MPFPTPELDAVDLAWGPVAAPWDTPALDAVNMSWVLDVPGGDIEVYGVLVTQFGETTFSQGATSAKIIRPNGFKASNFGPTEFTQAVYIAPHNIYPAGLRSTMIGPPSFPKILSSSVKPAGIKVTNFGEPTVEMNVNPNGLIAANYGPPTVSLNVFPDSAAPSTAFGAPEFQLSVTPASSAWFGQFGPVEIQEGPHC